MTTQETSSLPPLSNTQILLRSMLAGALGACVGETCTIPIDAAKVRL